MCSAFLHRGQNARVNQHHFLYAFHYRLEKPVNKLAMVGITADNSGAKKTLFWLICHLRLRLTFSFARSHKAFLCRFSFYFCLGKTRTFALSTWSVQSQINLMRASPALLRIFWAIFWFAQERRLSVAAWPSNHEIIALNKVPIPLSSRLEKLLYEDGAWQVCTAWRPTANNRKERMLRLWMLLEQLWPFPGKLVLPNERFAMRHGDF